MIKVALVAAGVLGFAAFAGAQTEVTIDFPNANDSVIPDVDPAGTTSYRLDYTPAGAGSSLRSWSGGFYGSSGKAGTTPGVSYFPGQGTWQVTIIADPGYEIFLDGFNYVRPPSATTSQTTINITATTNSKTINTATPTDAGGGGVSWTAGGVFARDYADAFRPRGTSITIAASDDVYDFAMDDFTFTFAAIPEPTMLAPMAMAATGLFVRRRRS